MFLEEHPPFPLLWPLSPPFRGHPPRNSENNPLRSPQEQDRACKAFAAMEEYHRWTLLAERDRAQGALDATLLLRDEDGDDDHEDDC